GYFRQIIMAEKSILVLATLFPLANWSSPLLLLRLSALRCYFSPVLLLISRLRNLQTHGLQAAGRHKIAGTEVPGKLGALQSPEGTAPERSVPDFPHQIQHQRQHHTHHN